jgi:hypothetical protein
MPSRILSLRMRLYSAASARHRVGLVEERAAADLLGGDRRVGDRELHRRVGAEPVEELAPGGEDRLLRLLAGALVADVGEATVCEKSPRSTSQMPSAHMRLEADGVVDVARRVAAAPPARRCVGELAVLLPEALPDGLAPAGEPSASARAPSLAASFLPLLGSRSSAPLLLARRLWRRVVLTAIGSVGSRRASGPL